MIVRTVPRQLTLPVSLSDSATFDNFYAAGNDELISTLRDFITQRDGQPALVYLYGEHGVGKTHLLYAVTKLARERARTSNYVPFREFRVTSKVLEQLDAVEVVCLDDVDQVAGAEQLERALLQLYELRRNAGDLLLMTARYPPQRVAFQLEDLVSRLQSGTTYYVKALNDNEKREALRLRAAARGIALGSEVVEYVMRRYPRDTHALFGLLDRVDRASLSARRRVTIPFLQELERQ